MFVLYFSSISPCEAKRKGYFLFFPIAILLLASKKARIVHERKTAGALSEKSEKLLEVTPVCGPFDGPGKVMPLTYRYVRRLSTFCLVACVVLVFVLICDN